MTTVFRLPDFHCIGGSNENEQIAKEINLGVRHYGVTFLRATH